MRSRIAASEIVPEGRFVAELARTISFHTMGSCERVMFAWLVEDIEALQAIQDTLLETGKPGKQ